MLVFILLQQLPIEPVQSQLEKITNPVLALLIMVLFAGLIFMYRFMNKQIATERDANTAKDEYIKEQNTLFLDYALKNGEVMKSLQIAIEADSSNHRTIEDLLRQNNTFLQTIMRETKI